MSKFCLGNSSTKDIVQLRMSLLVFIALVSAVVAIFGQDKSPRVSPRPVDGASIFRSHCAACHGQDGQGNGPASKALKEKVPDLTKLAERNNGLFPTSHVLTIIMFGADHLSPAHGSKEMPIYGPIFHEIESDQDSGNVRLQNITKYLESIQRK